MVPSQCRDMQGSESTVSHLLDVGPSMKKGSQQLSIVLWHKNRYTHHPNSDKQFRHAANHTGFVCPCTPPCGKTQKALYQKTQPR